MTKANDTPTLIALGIFGVFLVLYLTGNLDKPIKWLVGLNKYLGVKQ